LSRHSLADPDHHREAITSRPLLLHGVARQTRHAGQTRLTVASSHGRRDKVVQALRAIAAFFAELRRTAEQLTPPNGGPVPSLTPCERTCTAARLRSPPWLNAPAPTPTG
jgi:hypothetical protein